jgi:hypothetical protein
LLDRDLPRTRLALLRARCSGIELLRGFGLWNCGNHQLGALVRLAWFSRSLAWALDPEPDRRARPA